VSSSEFEEWFSGDVVPESASSSGSMIRSHRSSKCSWISRVQLVESDSSSAVETVSGFRSEVGLVAFCWFFVVWRRLS
jgi:hypothetical protein